MKNSKPSWWAALIPFAVLAVLIFGVARFFGSDSLSGASQVALLAASAVTVAMAMALYKKPWKELEAAIADNIKSIGTAIIILLLIGAISGSWMLSGVVPSLIYYGMKVITPVIFLFASCIICALVSIVTGSSWTTIATIGVAILGIGMVQGYSVGWIAGSIISGAYFGDKISPLSDTTVLASSSAGTPLFQHIRYMLITTVPSIAIALVIFLVVSICHVAPADAQMDEFGAALQAKFNISPWLLLVPVFTGVLIWKKVPAMLTLFSSALVAGIVALIAQPHIISEIAGSVYDTASGLSFKDGFMGVMRAFYGSTSVSTGNEMLDGLVATRGMNGMLSTIFLIICAVTFGGTMTGSGMIQSLTEKMTQTLKGRTSTVAATVTTGIFSNIIAGDQYISILLTSSLYGDLYRKNGLENRLLSRSTEDSATVTSVLVPWNSCGMTQATVLRVPTIEYLPYCFFNLISPLMSILIAAIGYKVYKVARES